MSSCFRSENSQKYAKYLQKPSDIYEEIGLLIPDVINPENGYRYYSIGQLKRMLFISRMKAYHFSLEETNAIMQRNYWPTALVGIAIDTGYIKSAGQKVLDFFPEYVPDAADRQKQEITLRHLLTMTAPYPFEDWHEPLDRAQSKSDVEYSGDQCSPEYSTYFCKSP